MAGIGGIACHKLSGNIVPMSERKTVFQIPGIDGYGIHYHGLGNGEHQIELVRFDSINNLNDWYLALRSLQAECAVTFVNDCDIESPLVQVMEVSQMKTQVALGCFPGGKRGQVTMKLLTVA